MTIHGRSAKPAWLSGDSDISHRLRLTADTLEAASNEIDTLRRALSWIGDYDPEMMYAAIERFGLGRRE